MKYESKLHSFWRSIVVLWILPFVIYGYGPSEASIPSIPRANKLSTVVGKLLFVDGDVGNFQIYSIKIDGSERRQLTTNGRSNYYPAWSPDGLQIAFVSDAGDCSMIHTMDENGENERELIHYRPCEHISGLSWSPDGKAIAFGSDRAQPQKQSEARLDAIYILRLYDLSVAQVSYSSTNLSDPVWSPTGDLIAATSYASDAQLYVLKPDGSLAFRVSDRYASYSPSWSPDGQRIVYWGDTNNGGLMLMNRDGSHKQKLLPDKPARYPVWSPDGGFIIFVPQWTRAVYIMRTNGSDMCPIPNLTGREFSLAWQPSGSADIAASALMRCETF
jgi:Tol biopolymer transport system component